MAQHRPIVLVHGYSDKGESFKKWCETLERAGYDTTLVHLGNYVSLSNEISVKDIAEGFDRALKESSLKSGQPFDVIVHSTGMLVVREWLAGTIGTIDRPQLAQERQARLKHLIGLAPATFGSPLAHKGRSWLGAMFKGGKQLGPDFMEAGEQVLKALELGSSYTWDLAHRDFLQDPPMYGRSAGTPYPFIFVGLRDYGWLKRTVTEPGTDGTVRWAGVGFNSRKVKVDLTIEATRRQRISIEPWKNSVVPTIFLPNHNHTDILQNPSEALVQMVMEALSVSSGPQYEAWATKHRKTSDAALTVSKAKKWQQLIVHAINERGDGIKDYFLEAGVIVDKRFRRLEAFDLDVHAFREDESFRCFHVDLDKLQPEKLDTLALRVIASSGTELVSYQGFDSSDELTLPEREQDKWDAVIQFDATIGAKDVAFFYPYTTTLVEIRLNREPMPLKGVNRVFWFGARTSM
jgi:Lipase (class 2)